MTSRLLALSLVLAASPAFAGTVGGCGGGSCPNREALEGLSAAPAGSSGDLYDNSRTGRRPIGGVTAAGFGTSPSSPRLSPPPVRAARSVVPAPDKAKEEDGEGSGVMGFLNKHKWQIAGSVIGTIAGFLIGGGLLGALLGVGIGLAVSFLGPKIFSGKK